jgi:hypothetical protein
MVMATGTGRATSLHPPHQTLFGLVVALVLLALLWTLLPKELLPILAFSIVVVAATSARDQSGKLIVPTLLESVYGAAET